MIRILLIALMLVSASACTKTTFVRSAPGYKDNLLQARTALLLPPTVEVHQIDFMSKKVKVHNYEDYLEEILVDTLLDKMLDKGYRVKLLSRTDIANGKLSASFVNTKDNFADTLQEFYSKGAWKEEQAYSVNQNIPSAVDIGKKSDTDLILLVNFSAAIKTRGAVTKDFTKAVLFGVVTGRVDIGNDKSEASVLRLAILEAKTGKVLWAHSVDSTNDMVSTTLNNLSNSKKADKANLAALLDRALKDLPSR